MVRVRMEKSPNINNELDNDVDIVEINNEVVEKNEEKDTSQSSNESSEELKERLARQAINNYGWEEWRAALDLMEQMKRKNELEQGVVEESKVYMEEWLKKNDIYEEKSPDKLEIVRSERFYLIMESLEMYKYDTVNAKDRKDSDIEEKIEEINNTARMIADVRDGLSDIDSLDGLYDVMPSSNLETLRTALFDARNSAMRKCTSAKVYTPTNIFLRMGLEIKESQLDKEWMACAEALRKRKVQDNQENENFGDEE